RLALQFFALNYQHSYHHRIKESPSSIGLFELKFKTAHAIVVFPKGALSHWISSNGATRGKSPL
ncbi:hypothetical protein, partial [Acinetobacter sp. YH12054]|uniref:hypothetical protein n=1 Tax=Acinetobacter sp. YH12054 TaxID=2601056 RepID=UPI001C55358E